MGKIRLGNSVRVSKSLFTSVFLLFLTFHPKVSAHFIDCSTVEGIRDPTLLTFMGQHFIAPGGLARNEAQISADQYFCVQATTDEEARIRCNAGNRRGFAARNPSNRQYVHRSTTLQLNAQATSGVGSISPGPTTAPALRGGDAHSPRGGSPLGGISYNIDTLYVNDTLRQRSELDYYFCIPASSENNRQRMCINAGNIFRGLYFSWGNPTDTDSSGGEDRDCYCGLQSRSRSDMRPCGDPQVLQQMQVEADEETANAPAEEVPVEAGALTQAQADTFNRCLGQVRNNAGQCRQAGVNGLRDCREPSGDNLLGGAAQAAGAISEAHNQGLRNTDSQAQCFQAALLSNGALVASRTNNTECRNAVSECDSTCGDGELNDYFRTRVRERCLAQLNTGLAQDISIEDLTNPSTATEESPMGSVASKYQQYFRESNEDVSRGRTQCETAKRQLSMLENLVQGVGRSLQSAAQCSCQYASSTANTQQVGTSNACATNLPNPNACATNPSLPGCEVYRELSPCTPGATYNAQMCRCQTNPSATGCEGTQTTGAVASMAGSSIRAGAVAGPTGFGIPAGGAVARNGIDLGGGSDGGAEGLQLDNKNGRAQIPKDPSVAGGGGAPPGGGATRDNGGLAGAGGEEKTLAAGLMNAAKNIGKALGLTKDKPNGNLKDGGKTAGGKKEPNLNSFRPRNVAGGRDGMGGKHMDIWKMMNKCVQAETCQSNMNNYILTP